MVTDTLYIGENSGEQRQGDDKHHIHTDGVYPYLQETSQLTHTTYVHQTTIILYFKGSM